MAIVRRTESNINHIMAHHSPVLIIQRHFRGILTRKRYVKKRENNTFITILYYKDYECIICKYDLHEKLISIII